MSDVTTETIRIFNNRNNNANEYQIKYKDANNQNNITIQNTLTSCVAIEWTQNKVSHVPTNLCLTGSASESGTLECQFYLDSSLVFRPALQNITSGFWTINIDFLMQAVNKGKHKLEVMMKVSSGNFIIDAANANLYIQLTGLTDALKETIPKISQTQVFTPVAIQFSAIIGIAALTDSLTAAVDTPIPISVSETFAAISISFAPDEIGIVLAENLNLNIEVV